MRDGTKVFSCMALRLNRIVLGTVAEKLNCRCLHLERLLVLGRKNHGTGYLYARSDSYLGDVLEITKSLLINDLQILEE